MVALCLYLSLQGIMYIHQLGHVFAWDSVLENNY